MRLLKAFAIACCALLALAAFVWCFGTVVEIVDTVFNTKWGFAYVMLSVVLAVLTGWANDYLKIIEKHRKDLGL